MSNKKSKYQGSDDLEQREAEYGERMIEIKIRFWTDNIADGPGLIRPKHAWSSGIVRVKSNKSHGITPGKPLPFHSLMDLTSVIEKALIAQGITLHSSRKMQKYFEKE